MKQLNQMNIEEFGVHFFGRFCNELKLVDTTYSIVGQYVGARY